MKKLVVFALFIAGVVFAESPANFTVGTNSVQLVPLRPIGSVDNWVTGTSYAQGTVVKNGIYYYFAKNAGTSGATEPTHTSGEASDGTVTWMQVNKKTRSGLVISVKTDGGKVDLSFNSSDATITSGCRLIGEGHAIIFGNTDNFQGEVHAVSATGSDVVIGVQEF